MRLSQCDKNVCIIVSSDPDLVCSGTVMPYALYNTCVALCIVLKCLFRHRSALEYTSTTSAPLNGNSRSLWALMSSIVENDHRERSKRRIYISTKTESCKFLTEVILTLSNELQKCEMCQTITYIVYSYLDFA